MISTQSKHLHLILPGNEPLPGVFPVLFARSDWHFAGKRTVLPAPTASLRAPTFPPRDQAAISSDLDVGDRQTFCAAFARRRWRSVLLAPRSPPRLVDTVLKHLLRHARTGIASRLPGQPLHYPVVRARPGEHRAVRHGCRCPVGRGTAPPICPRGEARGKGTSLNMEEAW